MNWRWRTPAALLALLVLTAGFYWKLTFTRGWTFLEGPDLAIQVRPWLDLAAREFHAGRFPLWDPYEWAGQTLIGQVQPGIANPLNWILFAMPLRDGHIPIQTLHWYWVLIHWLGAVAAYALCRDLGARFLPAILGGCIYALTGFLGHTDWPQILMGCVWIPVVLLFFLRVARDHRPLASAALAGAAMGMAFLGNHHVVPTFTVLLLGFLWLALICIHPRRVRYFAVFLLLTAMVSAVQVLPALEYSRRAIRWAGAPAPILPGDRVPFSVHAEYSLSFRDLPAMLLPRPSLHANPYIGLTAFALALFALFRRHPAARWLGAFALGGILLSLARDFPPYWLIYRFVPMVERAREPAFAIVLGQCGIAVLAALGLSRLPGWTAPLALLLFLGEAVYNAPHLNRFDRPGSYYQLQRDQAGAIAFLQRQPGWFRVDFDAEDVPYNAGDLYGIEQFGGAVSSMPVSTHRVLGHAETPGTYGIRYHVGRTPSHPAQVEVFQSRFGLRVYLDPRIAEPMWGFHQPACTLPDRFRLVTRLPERVILRADLGCPGLAIVGDPYYPGWRAWLDGHRVPVQEVDGVRAIRAGAGSHNIEFRYHPASVYWGFALTLAGLALAALLYLKDFRNSRAIRYSPSPILR